MICLSHITAPTRLKHRHSGCCWQRYLQLCSEGTPKGKKLSPHGLLNSRPVMTVSLPSTKERGLPLPLGPRRWPGCAGGRCSALSGRPAGAARSIPCVTRALTATRWANGSAPRSYADSNLLVMVLQRHTSISVSIGKNRLLNLNS